MYRKPKPSVRFILQFINHILACRARYFIVFLFTFSLAGLLYILFLKRNDTGGNLSGGRRMEESRLVHLDLKGAPPKLSYLQKLFPLFKKWGATGLLVEYEDTFPYFDELDILKTKSYYRPDDIHELLSSAREHNLDVVPPIQTFGHFEFVLKHEKFRRLREVEKYPNALCPSNPDSFQIVKKMIDQVMEFHPQIKYFHIGSDEVYHLAECSRCTNRLSPAFTKDNIFVDHVFRVAHYIKETYHIQPIMWDDMFRHFSLTQLLNSKIGEVVEPMVWQYNPDLDTRLPHDLFARYGQVFRNVWAASAFKGATGPDKMLTDISYHLENHKKWLNLISSSSQHVKHFQGFALTGWQRYDHYAVLCELLPTALPSLAINLQVLLKGHFTEQIHRDISQDLGLTSNELLQFSLPSIASPTSGSALKQHTYHEQPLSFPGSKIYNILHRFNVLHNKYKRTEENHQLNGMYESLLMNLHEALSEIYEQDTVEEYIAEHISVDMEKMKNLIYRGNTQIRLSDT